MNSIHDFFSVYVRGVAIQNIRYILFSGLAFFILFIWKRKKWNHLKIWQKPLRKVQLKHEVKWSMVTSIILGFIYLLIAYFTHLGFTKIYLPVSEKGIGYLLLSTAILIVWHDTWFYWIHRFMHLKVVLKKVHFTHHKSLDPSPLAAFAFHPLETILESGFMIIAVFLLPLHPAAILFVNLFQISMNVIGHSGHEFFPEWFVRHPIYKWFNSSTHHHMHHRHFSCNYGLYFNFWDRLLKTNHPRYLDTFDEVKQRKHIETDQ